MESIRLFHCCHPFTSIKRTSTCPYSFAHSSLAKALEAVPKLPGDKQTLIGCAVFDGDYGIKKEPWDQVPCGREEFDKVKSPHAFWKLISAGVDLVHFHVGFFSGWGAASPFFRHLFIHQPPSLDLQVLAAYNMFKAPESTFILWPGKETAFGAAHDALVEAGLQPIHMVWDKGQQSGGDLGSHVKYVSEDILIGVSKVNTPPPP